MWKVLGTLMAGVFIGALAVEILRRTRPGLIDKVEDSAKKAADVFTGAFKEGYRGSHAEPAGG